MKTRLITTENWGVTAIRFTLGVVLVSHGAQSMLVKQTAVGMALNIDERGSDLATLTIGVCFFGMSSIKNLCHE